ncbi:LysR family transcriptional regulator [Streptomyces violaceus]|uniref:helix-turn-helix domain-containing protein n=1 Tax=Streptomyces violaceus TaxID=1936 RepID=UPI002E21DDB4|nr:LysR family transcriptional regulator [Streptomyces violaceus]
MSRRQLPELPAQHVDDPAQTPDQRPGTPAEILPVTAGQREVWLAEQHSPDLRPALRLGEYLEIHGPIDPDLFEAALRQVVAETDALRVRLVSGEDGPVQVLERELSWSAAEQLRMSQPPLSRAILQLERQLGVRLFDRGERRVRLTETGRAFAE